jgi:hypothetical protein
VASPLPESPLPKATARSTLSDAAQADLESFKRFAAAYVTLWNSSTKELLAAAGGEDFVVSTQIATTDVKQTDSLVNPVVHELVIVMRVSKGDNVARIIESRQQFAYGHGWWEPVKASVKVTFDVTNSQPLGVEAPAEPDTNLARIAQGLPSK